jgi:hypothetical protein
MKVLVDSDKSEGLESFLGKQVVLWCSNYIYTGTLSGISDTDAKIENAKIVYETGPFDEPGWKDAQSLPGGSHYVRLFSIESYGYVK